MKKETKRNYINSTSNNNNSNVNTSGSHNKIINARKLVAAIVNLKKSTKNRKYTTF